MGATIGPVPESSTPSPSQPSASLGSRSPPLGAAAVVVGAAVNAFALWQVAPLLASPCADRRWAWGLGAMVLIAVPTSARELIGLGSRLLAKR